jgi:2-keto-4-pentenoate hydratase/2-oxohepta-3-ene-1,7-dioic acid hydratase in catechol pathway
MKLAVFDNLRIGVVEGDHVFDVTAAIPDALNDMPAQRMNWLIANWETARPRVESLRRDARAIDLGQVTLLAPNPAPQHVFAAPANYRKHVGELGARSVSKGRTAREQGFFLKAPGSLVGAGGVIGLPRGSSRRFDHESELAVVIGKRAWQVPRTEAMKHVFGYSCLIDATMRIEPGVAEEERSMRKSFAGFTPLGPYLVTADGGGREPEEPAGSTASSSGREHLRHDRRHRRADRADLFSAAAESGRRHRHRHSGGRRPVRTRRHGAHRDRFGRRHDPARAGERRARAARLLRQVSDMTRKVRTVCARGGTGKPSGLTAGEVTVERRDGHGRCES